MIFKNLSVVNFRNIEQFNISLNSRLNIFVGNNGQGKTNLIEALYLLKEGESFRYSDNQTLIKINNDYAFLSSLVENLDLEYLVKLKIGAAKKEYSINNKNISFESSVLPGMVLFSPESLNVIKESSEQRRTLIDQLLIQIQNKNKIILKEFRRVLKVRNKILKEISQEKIEHKMGMDTLKSIQPLYIKASLELIKIRLFMLNEIQPYVDESLKKINSTKETIFNYKYNISDIDSSKLEINEIAHNMQKRIAELENAEIRLGSTLVGPQKHDVIFLYNGNDSRYFCSQGQQRSIILAFKMAQIVYHHKVHGFYPVLLLDDVLSELDLNKQESLIETLNQTETQTFITTTDISLLSKLSINNSRVFKINNGQLI